MAFTYSVVKVTALAVNDQVAGFIAGDGHGALYPVPTTGAFLTTVRAKYPAELPPGASSPDGLTTVQLNNGTNFASLPIDFTINGTTDWVIKATGTA